MKVFWNNLQLTHTPQFFLARGKVRPNFEILARSESLLADLAATGWRHEFDALRREVAHESEAVKDFSDECRFWAARREPTA